MGEQRIDEERIDPGHKGIRDVLRVVGPIVLGIGLILIVVGVGSFFVSVSDRFGRDDLGFGAHGSFGPPKYFWCLFVGMPVAFAGLVMTGYGFMGKVARYQAGEMGPVVKDTFNYVAQESHDGIRSVASAIGEGFRGADTGTGGTKVRCHKCNELLEEDAKFCSNCGAAIVKSKECPGCRELNDPDAKFCDNCGYRFI